MQDDEENEYSHPEAMTSGLNNYNPHLLEAWIRKLDISFLYQSTFPEFNTLLNIKKYFILVSVLKTRL